MKAKLFGDSIYKVIDFIDESEQQILIDMIDSSSPEDWDGIGTGETWNNNIMKFDHQIGQLLFKKVSGLFINFISINPIFHIHRFKEEGFIGVHTDQMGKPDISFGVVIYINDNYDGGEIVYPDKNISIKPVARSLVIHPGNFLHKTNPVIGSNNRHMISTFVHGLETKVNIASFGEIINA